MNPIKLYPVWCYLCKDVVDRTRRENLSAASHAHIDSTHPADELQGGESIG